MSLSCGWYVCWCWLWWRWVVINACPMWDMICLVKILTCIAYLIIVLINAWDIFRVLDPIWESTNISAMSSCIELRYEPVVRSSMHWCQLGVRLDAWEMPDYWSLTEHGHTNMVHVWLYSAQNIIASVILNGGFLNLLLVVNIFTNLDDALGWFRWDQTSPNIKHKTACDHWRVDSDWKDRLLYLHDELVLQQKYLPR